MKANVNLGQKENDSWLKRGGLFLQMKNNSKRMLFKDLGLKIELGREKREQHMSKGAMSVRGVKCVRMVGRRLRI